VRVWDVAAGYLNRQSLLGEHRELHGLRSILVYGKTGYSRHPETLRWVGFRSGLAQRHEALVAEMELRGYIHRSPVSELRPRPRWPTVYITAPWGQIALLKSKYVRKERGRIPLPRNAQELRAHHKYSVMARDPETYRSIGRRISRMRNGTETAALAEDLVAVLRQTPHRNRVVDVLEHMWGHVSDAATADERRDARRDAAGLLEATRRVALRVKEPYLTTSTALSELAVFVTRRQSDAGA